MKVDKRELQRTLVEVLGESENDKKSEIPRNVDSSYKVILDLNMKGIVVAFSPFYTVLPISLLLLALFNMITIVTGIVAFFITIVLFMVLYGLLTISPIKERDNLKMYHHFLYRKRFNDRQKVFFLEESDS